MTKTIEVIITEEIKVAAVKIVEAWIALALVILLVMETTRTAMA